MRAYFAVMLFLYGVVYGFGFARGNLEMFHVFGAPVVALMVYNACYANR